jgi:hypothetical protein
VGACIVEIDELEFEVERAVELEGEVEVWPQSAAGTSTDTRTGKTIRNEIDRKHCRWRLEQLAKAIEPRVPS